MSKAARETGKYVRFLEQALVELARVQHGVFGLYQLRELGLTDDAVRKRVAAGRLHRIHRGVYSLVPRELLRREGLYMAAVLACGEGAALSHRSAARLHGLGNYGNHRIEVTVPKRSQRTHSGVAVHTSTTLTPADVTVVNGIPTTTVARTLFDLGDAITPRQLERAFDQADIMQALDLNEVRDQLARNHTRPAAKAVKHLLKTHYIGSTPTENEFEDAFLALTRSLNLPDPTPQFYIDLGDGEPLIRADFAWPDRKIVVETDGRRTHGTNNAFESDRRRDQRLTAAGWTVIRTTWRQLKQRPHELRPILLKLLGSRPGSPNGRGKPGAAGVPAPGQPQTQRAGGSTS
ncbi:MAG TPA: type IV toxin-antitoxin system AbiEi family antitoxin domain-containing protein [Solirubrobacteraceae bacterium]|nr:type IV toxin-antitoxin system AbiEi family antitoxin domain-containing protein [Solirubrobacteraceae bacterium]